MLLQLSTQRPQARDLSYLLHKHPDRVQSVEIPSGRAHIFYPQADDQVCPVCLA
ncbi:MAG TPA: 3' terminal RNA ribose 2'-O-methyltransferase Hen1, partial [Cytophagales bacterium]|nr:3' terminal RNA ribose 2'-O-methyltransferase Hen1 [Cytophagales bacterium]